ncbi:MAG TPA: carbohydrate-binding family 9-like protein, partial [Chthonomonadales bacterium]|nr:carbohydrate-binding family 9-like protein [Chthonomonadales bacterium]
RDGGPPVTGWDIAGLQTAVHVDGTLNDCSDRDRGWSVEMALPWHALAECAHRKTPPAEGDLWRINFSRVEWDINVVDGRASKIPDHPEHNWVWSPQGAVNMHLPEHWGYLQFTNLPPRRARAITDPAATVRAGLMQIYYAQSQYHRQHGAYAPVIADLRSCGAGRAEGLRNLKVEATETGFVASATQELPGGRSARWHVKEDSRLWTQPAD